MSHVVHIATYPLKSQARLIFYCSRSCFVPLGHEKTESRQQLMGNLPAASDRDFWYFSLFLAGMAPPPAVAVPKSRSLRIAFDGEAYSDHMRQHKHSAAL